MNWSEVVSPLLTACVLSVTALAVLLVKKLLSWLDVKTSYLDQAKDAELKATIKSRVLMLAEVFVESTMQTLVKKFRLPGPKVAGNEHLTKAEAGRAFERTKGALLHELLGDGIEVGRHVGNDFVTAAIESAVLRFKAAAHRQKACVVQKAKSDA